MTVPVRRHAYVRNTYVTMLFREDPLDTSLFIRLPDRYVQEEQEQNISASNETTRSVAPGLLERILDIFSPVSRVVLPSSGQSMRLDDASDSETAQMRVNNIIRNKVVNFVVPLAGRWAIFERFIQNYERVCLAGKERTRLVVVLFENDATQLVAGNKQSELIRQLFADLREKYQLDGDEKALNLIVNEGIFE